MKKLTFALVFLFLFTKGFAQNVKSGSKIIVNNPAIHQLIVKNEVIEILAEGFEWSEGQLWITTENKLIFSDIPKNSIFEWSEKGGKKPYLKPAVFLVFELIFS